MIVKAGESRQDTLRSGTYDSISLIAYLAGQTANTAINAAGYNPSLVNVKCLLKRNGKNTTIFQDNLQLLGIFNSYRKGYSNFINGVDKVYPAAGVKPVKLRPVTLYFGSPLRINPGDELVIEITPASTVFTHATVDGAASYIEFYANETVGYELGVGVTTCEVIQAASNKQSFNPGDFVNDLMIVNLDKDTLTDEVITNFQLSSDKLNLGLSFNQLLERNSMFDTEGMPYRYGTAVPVTLASQDVFRGLPFNPQTFVISKDIELNNVRIDMSFNSSQVANAQNYVIYRRLITDRKTLAEAINRKNKHMAENYDKLPAFV